HSISAFCNAGFSTLSSGLNDSALKTAYGFQWIIMHLIILGGLGYSIVFNFLKYLKQFTINSVLNRKIYTPVRVLTLNSKLVVVTTAILLTVGTLFFYFTESGSLFKDKSFFGKLTAAGFTSV